MKIYGVNKRKKEISDEEKVRRGAICIAVIIAMIIALIVLKPHNEKTTDPRIAIQEQMDAVIDSLLSAQSAAAGFTLPVEITDTQEIEHIKIWPPCPFEEEKNDTRLQIRNLEVINALKNTDKVKKEIAILQERIAIIDKKIAAWKSDTLNMLNYDTRRIRFTDGAGKKYVCFQNIDRVTGEAGISYLYNVPENMNEAEGQKLLDELTQNE